MTKTDKHRILKIISSLPRDTVCPSLPYCSAPGLIFASKFPRKNPEKLKVDRRRWVVNEFSEKTKTYDVTLKVLWVLAPLKSPLINTLNLLEALKLATTLKTLSPFAISIKHSAFSSLVLRLFEKVSALCSFFALAGFFVAKKQCILVQIS